MACAVLANFPCLIYFDKTTHFYLKPEISQRHGLLPDVLVSWHHQAVPALERFCSPKALSVCRGSASVWQVAVLWSGLAVFRNGLWMSVGLVLCVGRVSPLEVGRILVRVRRVSPWT